MQTKFSSAVKGTSTTLNSLEDLTASTNANSERVADELVSAAHHRARAWTLEGGAVGAGVGAAMGLLLGPPGALVGCAAGGALGSAAGKLLKDRQNQQISQVERNLARSNSLASSTPVSITSRRNSMPPSVGFLPGTGVFPTQGINHLLNRAI